MTMEQTEYERTAAQALAAFRKDLTNAEALQRGVLEECIARNAGSAFGKQHGFSAIHSEAEFRAAIPIRTYEEFSPWIERAAAGERGVLTEVEPAVFLTSSGSTGDSKRVPMTPLYVERSFMPFFFTALGNTLRYCPSSIQHPDATLNMKWDPLRSHGATSAGVPAMGASQVDFARRFGQALAAEPGTRAASARIPAAITDELERIYYRLRIAAEYDVRALIGINPSMVIALPALLDRFWERLVRELFDGTVHGERVREPHPERARALDAVAAHAGERLPSVVWPNLELVFCWTGGAAKIYTDEIRRAFGGRVQVLPAPLAASEAPVAVPIDRHPTAGVLFVSGAYYEFIDADRAISADAPTRRWDELEVGQELHVVASHVGGLYRYALGDVVRVVDHVAGVPRVEYACRHRSARLGMVSLREGTIVEAVGGALRPAGLSARGFVACADAYPRRLGIAVELATSRPVDGDAEVLAERIDRALAAANPSYRHARQGGELVDPQVVWMPRGTLTEDWCARVATGVRPTQVKDRIFTTAADWARLTKGAGPAPGGEAAEDRAR
jgi:GH3 auxin-responsive promoter